jgi:hypothetical protein
MFSKETFWGLSNLGWTAIGAIITFLAVFMALFGDQIKNWFFKPKIQAVEPKVTAQKHNGKTFLYHRLIVKNARRTSLFPWLPTQAKGVRVLLTYKNLPNENNFIPIPLRWTHFNESLFRDLPFGEEAYVDIFVEENNDGKYKFCWAPNTGSDDPDLAYYNPQYGDIRLEFFEQNQKIGDIYIEFNLDKKILQFPFKQHKDFLDRFFNWLTAD